MGKFFNIITYLNIRSVKRSGGVRVAFETWDRLSMSGPLWLTPPSRRPIASGSRTRPPAPPLPRPAPASRASGPKSRPGPMRRAWGSRLRHAPPSWRLVYPRFGPAPTPISLSLLLYFSTENQTPSIPSASPEKRKVHPTRAPSFETLPIYCAKVVTLPDGHRRHGFRDPQVSHVEPVQELPAPGCGASRRPLWSIRSCVETFHTATRRPHCRRHSWPAKQP